MKGCALRKELSSRARDGYFPAMTFPRIFRVRQTFEHVRRRGLTLSVDDFHDLPLAPAEVGQITHRKVLQEKAEISYRLIF